mgnify:CR=1 FL=1
MWDEAVDWLIIKAHRFRRHRRIGAFLASHATALASHVYNHDPSPVTVRLYAIHAS